LARNIDKKIDVNDYSFVYLTLILLLHYLVKSRSRSLNSYWAAHASAQKIIVSPQNHWKSLLV